MLQVEHSAILSTFIKLPIVIKIFVLSIFEWPFYTGFTVSYRQAARVQTNLSILNSFIASNSFCRLLLIFANSFDPDPCRQNSGGPDLDLNHFHTLIVFWKDFVLKKVNFEKKSLDYKKSIKYPACKELKSIQNQSHISAAAKQ